MTPPNIGGHRCGIYHALLVRLGALHLNSDFVLVFEAPPSWACAGSAPKSSDSGQRNLLKPGLENQSFAVSGMAGFLGKEIRNWSCL